jgi:hypothetical protein
MSNQAMQREWTSEDRKSSTLKIQIAECDPFTQAALERQAKIQGVSLEQYITEGVFSLLECDEQEYW